jgi:hypothetical protein
VSDGSLAAFSALFRRSAVASLEYSIGDDPETFGTMVRGDAELVATIGAFIGSTSFAADWYAAAERMFQHIRPTVALFRVDWRGECALGATVYMKFRQPPNGAEIAATLAHALPFRWYGPSPTALAEALGLAGPSGIALRVLASGAGQLASYYLIEARNVLGAELAARVLGVAKVTCNPEVILRDSAILSRTCPLSVVGLDGGSPTSNGTLKLDWGEVRPRIARALIVSKGALPAALARFDKLSLYLRSRWLSYFSMKYGSSAYVGWRAYFSTEPHRHRAIALPAIHTGRPAPASRMPHY